MHTAIVTGGNGFIGSRLLQKLLSRSVSAHAIGRRNGNVTWRERVKAALDDITGEPVDARLLQNLHCHEMDLCSSDFDLSLFNSGNTACADTVLFHVAGDTRFNPPDPDMQRRINVSGSLNIMQCLRDVVGLVVHVSTAYVAGDRNGLILESDLDKGQSFRNCYEKSKLEAEIAVRELCSSLSLPLCIVRPSIITNDTATGRSSAFTHLNALVEVIGRVQKHYGIGDGQTISDEIRIPVDPSARPNLAPVDPIVDSLLEISASDKAPGNTFHLCHPRPQPNSEVIALLAEALNVTGKIGLPFVQAIPADPSWTEKMMLRSLRPYLPYLNESCTFDLNNTRSIIPDYDSRFPGMTLEYLHRVIDFQRCQESLDPSDI